MSPAPSWAENGQRHDTTFFWSHAGRQFNIYQADRWYAALTEEEQRCITIEEWAGIQREHRGAEFGDRRQEIVFIGTNLQPEALSKALDECLCTDEEMKVYKRMAKRYEGSKSS